MEAGETNKEEAITQKVTHKVQKIPEEAKIHRKGVTIFGISLWRMSAYFILYSMAGYFIETVFGIVTKGVWESRQSFLYGPFCAVYGLGATIMIVSLQKFKKSQNLLFIGGFVVGSIVEYAVSWIGEILLHVKWWDYSNNAFNINGRICVYYSIFWGFLAIYLMMSFNPKVDKLIDKIKSKFKLRTLKIVTIITILFLLVDCILTGFAISFFKIRMIVENDIKVANKQEVQAYYEEIYGNKWLSDFIYCFWGDRKMIRTFPNLKIQDVEGNIIYFDSFLDIQQYYLRIYEK